MSLTGSTNEEKIWNFFKSKLNNEYGVAGLMGNLYAESALNPQNLQDTYETKLGYTDATYTAAVDNGTYTNFVKDSAGYGLAQWTYWSRKQALLDYIQSQKLSIGSLEGQLNYLYKELQSDFSSVVTTLKNATSVSEASNAVLLKFEQPADQSSSVQTKRTSYGQTYYNKYATKTGGTSTVSTYDKYINSTGTHYISNSGHDENGAYKGGTAGDQTGEEWYLRSWYNRPWNCVLRYPDESVRTKIAELGCAAALNDKIGYDQNQRNTYWTQLQKANYDPSAITTACEADCSAGVIANVKAVGYLLGISALQNLSATYTGNMKSGFKSAGFEVLTDSKYLTGYTYLLPGDILLNESAHTATNITKGSNASSSSSTTTTTSSSSSSSSSPSKTVQFTGTVTASTLNVRKGAGTSYGTCSFSPLSKGTSVDVCDTVTASDGSSWYYICYNGKYGYASASYISKTTTTTTTSSSSSSSKTASESAASQDASLAGTYTTTAKLNVRDGAGTNKSILVTIPKGTKVTNYGYYTKVSGVYWLYVQFTYNNIKYTGFCSKQYLTK